MYPDSPQKMCQNKQKLYSLSQTSLLSEPAQKNTEKDTQFYLTNMNEPLLLLLFLQGNIALQLSGCH